MKKILIPLPTYGCDPTEVSVPWKLLRQRRINVAFATPDGQPATADQRMLKSQGLGIWKAVLGARSDAVQAWSELEKSTAFSKPMRYDQVQEPDFDALFLPGGHDKGMIEYLESEKLQKLVADFFEAGKIVAAICHGVIVVARSKDPKTGKSVIFDYQTTALLKAQEKLAFNMTRLWLKDYYLTYPGLTVEEEVKSVLTDESNFLKGPKPFKRDDEQHLERGFFVRDRNYLSARWPGDAYRFSYELIKMLEEKQEV